MIDSPAPVSLEDILRIALQKNASDVHLKAGIVPIIRRFGKLRPLSRDAIKLTGYDIDQMAFSIMDEKQKQFFRDNKHIDLGHGISGLGRFRINIFRQRGTTRMVIRNIPHTVPRIEDLNLPEAIHKVTGFERGLILVTGITGSGKSTTMAALIDQINQTKNKHIITIEDPIEFLIRDRKSIISQREVGTDARDYDSALKSALRQDPDVLLIGEMRDRETMETAISAAETGHLVLSTLHTADAQETINRILATFPPHQHAQIRYQLSSVLKCVISQRLARREDGKGFIPAIEILFNNARISEMISEPERTQEIRGAIAEGATWGMQSFDQSLHELVQDNLISFDTALELSTHPENFKLRHSGVSSKEDKMWKESDEEASKVTKIPIDNTWNRLESFDLESPTEKSAKVNKRSSK